jgi:L,D-peptidoglycan transpeptidase YkuD (ErfK/YbiS/YcfS/YnhG family)
MRLYLPELLVGAAGRPTQGLLEFAGQRAVCALGRSGISLHKREGDGATPAGRWPLRRVLYRADRVPRPKTGLPVDPIAEADGWCDDPADPAYNRPVRLPYAGNAECLWRADKLYDIVVVLGHNDSPVVPGKGSAIFLHIAEDNYQPTAGCIAVSLSDMMTILPLCDPGTALIVRPDKAR